jgi:hypothetical protein
LDFGTGASQKNDVFLEGRNRRFPKNLRFFGQDSRKKRLSFLSFFLRKKEQPTVFWTAKLALKAEGFIWEEGTL